MTKVAITALVGEFDHFVDEANQMTLSGSELDSRFTFVLFVEPEVVHRIKKRHNVLIYPYKSKNDEYYNNYRYAKSLEFVESNEYILKQYDYIIKTDTDVFFSPHINCHDFDDKMYFGRGHFKSWAVEQMYDLAKKLGFNNYQSLFEPNSTVMGPTDDVIRFMKVVDEVCKHVLYTLKPSGIWKEDFHLWGKDLFSGTSTLIAQDLVLTEMFNPSNVVITNKMDADCTSTSEPINSVYHVTQWHVDAVYSKFKAREGKYDNLEYREDNSISSYCLNIHLKNKREP